MSGRDGVNDQRQRNIQNAFQRLLSLKDDRNNDNQSSSGKFPEVNEQNRMNVAPFLGSVLSTGSSVYYNNRDTYVSACTRSPIDTDVDDNLLGGARHETVGTRDGTASETSPALDSKPDSIEKIAITNHDVSYTDVAKLREMHFEVQSYLWISQASHIKFKTSDGNKIFLCKLIHGESTLGGSLLRVVEWGKENNVLFSFDQNDILGAKVISKQEVLVSSSSNLTFLKSFKRIFKGRINVLNEENNTADSTRGEVLEEFPLNHSNAGSCLIIYSYPKQNNESSVPCRRKEHHIFLELAEDSVHMKSCERSICSLANPNKINRCLVILGSHSKIDKQKALFVYDKIVRKMFSEANIEHDLFQTLYEGHAYDRIKEGTRKNSKGVPIVLGKDIGEQIDARHYDAIVVVGGDSIVTQVIQAMMSRSDKDMLLRQTCVGIIPVRKISDSNGISCSLSHACQDFHGAVEATFAICKGRTELIDLSSYQTDLDDSLIGLIGFSTNFCNSMKGIARNNSQIPNVLTIKAKRVRLSMLSSSRNSGISSQGSLSISQPVPPEWNTVELDIFLFYACQLTNSSNLNLISPFSRLDDGILHIFVFRRPASTMEAAYLIKSIQNGDHIHNEYCQIYTCIAYRLELLPEVWEEGSYGLLDHSSIKFSSIQGRILPQRCRMFCGDVPVIHKGYFIS